MDNGVWLKYILALVPITDQSLNFDDLGKNWTLIFDQNAEMVCHKNYNCLILEQNFLLVCKETP